MKEKVMSFLRLCRKHPQATLTILVFLLIITTMLIAGILIESADSGGGHLICF